MNKRNVFFIDKGKLNTSIWFVLFYLVLMILSVVFIYEHEAINVSDGVADLRSIDFQESTVLLNGDWEFYWNQLLTTEDFGSGQGNEKLLVKVPGAWSRDKRLTIPNQGVATYHVIIQYPKTLKDPAVRIQNVATAYKVYANGELLADAGHISRQASDFVSQEKLSILALPSDSESIELFIQVGSQHYLLGGLRERIAFGSKQVLDQSHTRLMLLQAFFSGSVFIFGIYYLMVFTQQRRNYTALIFGLLCLMTALRTQIWGESIVDVYFPNIAFDLRAFINYLTGYNMVPLASMLVLSLYPTAYKKRIAFVVLAPSLLFNLLLLTPTPYASRFTSYVYPVMLIQMLYLLLISIKSVLLKLEDAKLVFSAMGLYVLCIVADIMLFLGYGGTRIPYLFLFGNLIVIIFMSFIQSKQQANNYKKVLLYNQQLIESDYLKDKIMETEMSFLQAQIKPHFLYNALSAIANVSEKDGKAGSDLIIDLAVYLRNSLQFNYINKTMAIENELEFVDKYFHIEQARFGPKIQLIYEIDLNLSFQIPVLVVQPLVENAVRHGISKKTEGGSVCVSMIKTDGGICIEIRDDGVGMKQSDIDAVFIEDSVNNHTMVEGTRGVGLLNTHHRLMRLYGTGLEIKSELGRGTSVKFVIPEERKILS